MPAVDGRLIPTAQLSPQPLTASCRPRVYLTLTGDNICSLLLPGHGRAQIPQPAYPGELPAYPKVTKLSH